MFELCVVTAKSILPSLSKSPTAKFKGYAGAVRLITLPNELLLNEPGEDKFCNKEMLLLAEFAVMISDLPSPSTSNIAISIRV